MEAKKRGLQTMETENHGDNLPMLAINRKLGFHFTTPEAACIKHFSAKPQENLLFLILHDYVFT